MILTIVTNKGLLPLLKRLEHLPSDDSDRNPIKFCPECCCQQPGHESHCDLNAAIIQLQDQLDAEKKHRDDYLEGNA